jgi:hypothetical protein
MPITLNYGPPAGLEALLALETGRATGQAKLAQENRQAAEKAQELRFRAAQEEFRARQEAYRQHLQAQTQMALSQQQAQQHIAYLQAQQQWQAQQAQRETEQLQQQRKANREAFLSGQMGLSEYQQADAAFAARMAGLDPNAQAKERQSLLDEFQKRADPSDQSALKGIHSKIAQLRQMVASGQYSGDAVQGALAGLQQKERALLEGVQHKPDKSGPNPIEEAQKNLIPGDQIGMSSGTKYQWVTRAGQRRLEAVDDPVLNAKLEQQAKIAVEQAKAEVKGPEKFAQQEAQRQAQRQAKVNTLAQQLWSAERTRRYQLAEQQIEAKIKGEEAGLISEWEAKKASAGPDETIPPKPFLSAERRNQIRNDLLRIAETVQYTYDEALREADRRVPHAQTLQPQQAAPQAAPGQPALPFKQLPITPDTPPGTIKQLPITPDTPPGTIEQLGGQQAPNPILDATVAELKELRAKQQAGQQLTPQEVERAKYLLSILKQAAGGG